MPRMGGRPACTASGKMSSKSYNKSRTARGSDEGKSLVENRTFVCRSTKNGAVVFLTSLKSLLLTNKHSVCHGRLVFLGGFMWLDGLGIAPLLFLEVSHNFLFSLSSLFMRATSEECMSSGDNGTRTTFFSL